MQVIHLAYRDIGTAQRPLMVVLTALDQLPKNKQIAMWTAYNKGGDNALMLAENGSLRSCLIC